MRTALRTALLATLVVSLTAQAPADEPTGDLARLQGSWTTKLGPNKDRAVTLTVKGATFEVKVARPDGAEATLKGDLKLDEKAEPRTFDFVNFRGDQGQDVADNLGIYKLDADTWTTCSGGPGNPRPTRFEAGEDGPPSLGTWARVKPAADDKPLPGDLAKFQGTWLASAGANEEVVVQMTVKGNAYTAIWDGGDGSKVEIKGEIRMNDLATPRKTVDFFRNQRNDGEDARDNLGIYEIKGDELKVCVGGAGNERPTEFKAGEGGAPLLLRFTRKKP